MNALEVARRRRDEDLKALVFAAREADADFVGLAPLEAAARSDVFHRGRPADHEVAECAFLLEGREIHRVFGGVARVAGDGLFDFGHLLALFEREDARYAKAHRRTAQDLERDV